MIHDYMVLSGRPSRFLWWATAWLTAYVSPNSREVARRVLFFANRRCAASLLKPRADAPPRANFWQLVAPKAFAERAAPIARSLEGPFEANRDCVRSMAMIISGCICGLFTFAQLRQAHSESDATMAVGRK